MSYFHEYPEGHEHRRVIPSIWLTRHDLWECECGHDGNPTECERCEECDAPQPEDPTITPDAWAARSCIPGCLPDSEPIGYFPCPATALMEYLQLFDLPGDPVQAATIAEHPTYGGLPGTAALLAWINNG